MCVHLLIKEGEALLEDNGRLAGAQERRGSGAGGGAGGQATTLPVTGDAEATDGASATTLTHAGASSCSRRCSAATAILVVVFASHPQVRAQTHSWRGYRGGTQQRVTITTSQQAGTATAAIAAESNAHPAQGTGQHPAAAAASSEAGASERCSWCCLAIVAFHQGAKFSVCERVFAACSAAAAPGKRGGGAGLVDACRSGTSLSWANGLAVSRESNSRRERSSQWPCSSRRTTARKTHRHRCSASGWRPTGTGYRCTAAVAAAAAAACRQRGRHVDS